MLAYRQLDPSIQFNFLMIYHLEKGGDRICTTYFKMLAVFYVIKGVTLLVIVFWILKIGGRFSFFGRI